MWVQNYCEDGEGEERYLYVCLYFSRMKLERKEINLAY